jgi:uncharacterized protein
MANTHIPRLFQAPPKGSYFLFGPRGCGKSTWLRALHPHALWFDLLDEGLYQRLLVDPDLFRAQLETLPEGAMVVVDEVQRLPGLLNVVQMMIEAKGLRFALSGSSARKLRRSGVNLLAGRAVRRTLHPFIPEELAGEFDLERTLREGALPLVWASADPRDTLNSYVQMYLKEEIQAEAATRNLSGFARFLPIAALFHGQTLNVSSLARDAGVARSTVQGYLQILEDTLFTFQVPAFESKLRVRERRHPKLYWVDPGLVQAVAGRKTKDAAVSRGAIFEGWIAQLLRAYGDYRGLYDELAYWAPAGAKHTEVDFVLSREGGSIAVEVKASTRWRPEFLKGLRAIEGLPGLTRRLVVYLGQEELRPEPGVEVLPVANFLRELERGL